MARLRPLREMHRVSSRGYAALDVVIGSTYILIVGGSMSTSMQIPELLAFSRRALHAWSSILALKQLACCADWVLQKQMGLVSQMGQELWPQLAVAYIQQRLQPLIPVEDAGWDAFEEASTSGRNLEEGAAAAGCVLLPLCSLQPARLAFTLFVHFQSVKKI